MVQHSSDTTSAASSTTNLEHIVSLCENQINETIELVLCNGAELNVTDVASELPIELRTASTVICVIVLLLGITGNLLVPYVVFRTKDLRNSTNLFLINLSIADLLVLIVCMPTVLIELHSNPEIWLLGENMCKVVPFVETAVAHGSILTILAISFERYYAICKPLKAGYKCTKFRAVVIIACVWALATISTIPTVFISELLEASDLDGALVPVCISQPDTTWKKVYFLATIGAFFWTPLIILLVVYFIITKRLCMDDIRGTSLVQHSEHLQMKARRQVVFMLAAVVACFFVCLLPFRVLTTWLIFSSPEDIKALGMESYYTILYACRIMLYLNSAVNPVLYNLISSKFRDAFMTVLCCKRSNRLLLRQSTFNTTSSSLVMTSLKKSPFLRQESKGSKSSRDETCSAFHIANTSSNRCHTVTSDAVTTNRMTVAATVVSATHTTLAVIATTNKKPIVDLPHPATLGSTTTNNNRANNLNYDFEHPAKTDHNGSRVTQPNDSSRAISSCHRESYV